MHLREKVLGVAASLLLGLSTSAGAVTNFSAVLDGLQEAPPNGSPATGVGTCVLSDNETTVTINITYTGLVGTPNNGHIHVGAVGVAGPVIVPFSAPFTSPITGTYPITPAQVIELKAGNTYFNVHSTAVPSGEIRGQITPDPVPVEPSTWSGIKALYN